MITLKKILATSALAVAGLIGCASANAFTFQGVTWNFTAVDADTVTLTITGLDSPSGNWSNITHLWTLSLNPTGDFTSALITPPGTYSGNELTAFGCTGGLSGKACFTFDPFIALTDPMVFTIDFANYTGDFTTETGIGVKVGFVCSPTTSGPTAETKACGSLMSHEVEIGSTSTSTSTSTTSTSGDVPEPGTLTLLGLGLLGFGYMRRFRKAA